jgi:hypothetical protein
MKLCKVLPKRLPRTIEDSIIAVKALGLRYPWIDRYCVQQVHSADKLLQIGQMAKICGLAFATICALGDHDDYGLPGVSVLRKRNHLRSQDDYAVARTAPARSLQSSISNSAWSTRGWTYQETYLSHRGLFFTSEVVFMVCRESCSSAWLGHHPDVELSKSVRLTPKRLLQTWYNHSVDYDGDIRLSFEDHVNAYQGRTLKYDSDRLFAFEGLLQSQELDTIFGVPIMKIPPDSHDSHEPTEIGFAHGLAWRNATRLNSRRLNSRWCPSNYIPHFPSWSWISRTDAQVKFQYFGRTIMGFSPRTSQFRTSPSEETEKIVFCADIAVMKDGAITESISDFIAVNHKRQVKTITEGIMSLKLDSVVVRWSINERPYTWDPSVSAFIYLETSSDSNTPDWFDLTDGRHSAYSDGSLATEIFVDGPGNG